MPDEPELARRGEAQWVSRLAGSRPDVVMMAPFMAYLLFLPLSGLVTNELGKAWLPLAILARGAAGFSRQNQIQSAETASALTNLFLTNMPSTGD